MKLEDFGVFSVANILLTKGLSMALQLALCIWVPIQPTTTGKDSGNCVVRPMTVVSVLNTHTQAFFPCHYFLNNTVQQLLT